MKDKLITYSESYEFIEYGLHRWKKIGIESDLEEGDDPIECHITQVKKVEAMKATSIAELESMRGTTVTTINPIDATIQGLIEDINGCTVVDEVNGLGVQTGLLAYLPMTAHYPEIKAAYDNKLEQLTKN